MAKDSEKSGEVVGQCGRLWPTHDQGLITAKQGCPMTDSGGIRLSQDRGGGYDSNNAMTVKGGAILVISWPKSRLGGKKRKVELMVSTGGVTGRS